MPTDRSQDTREVNREEVPADISTNIKEKIIDQQIGIAIMRFHRIRYQQTHIMSTETYQQTGSINGQEVSTDNRKSADKRCYKLTFRCQ